VKTNEEIVNESLEAANAARVVALARVQAPPWLPAFLCFDLDNDKIPDVLEIHMWSEAMSAILWAILTFASPNTLAYRAAVKVQNARDAAIAAGYIPTK
jgi:hypothetical protein